MNGKTENWEVEGHNFRLWEERFLKVWEFFRKGDPRLYPSFWKDCSADEFLNERNSRNYLDIWLERLTKK